MIRNIDLTALRSFVTVAETGGVTRAAQQLHLTQSAVSMQIKRLEEMLQLPLLDRAGRGVTLTAHGEQLLGYGRRILAVNDEAITRMMHDAFEGEVRLGVPTDIVYPHIPRILRQFDREFPRVKIHLVSSYTRQLKDLIESGDRDLILTTENHPSEGGEVLADEPLVWVGAPGGSAWRSRPLRLAFEQQCLFRPWAQEALDRAGIPWEMAVDTRATRTVEASVSADLAVHAMLKVATSPHLEPIQHGGVLPDLPSSKIVLYRARKAQGAPVDGLAEMLRQAYSGRLSLAAE
ncbi:LysR family transcriptional regulator [Paralimibaculum aggregatum]|uniref:LysR family transcriptional regulator n=1 Tax=Paralimibaculum aggregatum TaxID=3036245 RepID=A0ABQ6LKY3_9RHOB|nr:LysR family transcriptional regulator [Limibaculum sp. NKW23]GMG83884.1 LysR family transcriptional regulator [Limibaculum sp. NKW23]